MKKRFIVMLLCLVMMIGILPVSAMAAEIVDSGTCGEGLKWTLDSDGTLTISGEGSMDGLDGLDNEKKVKSVFIEEGVTEISGYCFLNCSNLKSVTIADSVEIIKYNAFHNCAKLESIVIPSGVKFIDEEVFYKCYNLSEVYFEGNAPMVYENIFSFDGITIYYPEGDLSWDSLKNRWGETYNWVEYDPESSETNAVFSENEFVEQTEENVNGSEKIKSDGSSGLIALTVLRGVLTGIFGVLVLTFVVVAICLGYSSATKRKKKGSIDGTKGVK